MAGPSAAGNVHDATGHAIGGHGAHDQTRNGSADRQQADKDRVAMYVAAPLSGNDVTEGETNEASARKSHG